MDYVTCTQKYMERKASHGFIFLHNLNQKSYNTLNVFLKGEFRVALSWFVVFELPSPSTIVRKLKCRKLTVFLQR